jgi:hypothetical protein
MTSAERESIGTLRAEPPAGSRGKAPCQGVRGEAHLKLAIICVLTSMISA